MASSSIRLFFSAQLWKRRRRHGADRWLFLLMPLLLAQTPAPPAAQERGTFRLKLERGWNLVSVPIHADAPGLPALFPAAIRRAGIWTYAGADTEYRAVTRLEPFTGCWVYAPRLTTVRVPGRVPEPSRIGLEPGWNLVGPAATLAVAALPAAVDGVWRWDTARDTYERETVSLQPGRGYWVKCGSAPCELVMDAAAVDADADGVRDIWEDGYGSSPLTADTDADGLSDFDELFVVGTDPADPDTDGDGLRDGWEQDRRGTGFDPLLADTDADGIDDGDGDGDGDELTNALEQALGTDPGNADTDADGLWDWLDPEPRTPGLTRARVLHLRAGWNARAWRPAATADGALGLPPGISPDAVRSWSPDEQDWVPAEPGGPQRGRLFWGDAPEQAWFVTEPVQAALDLELGPGWNFVSSPLTVTLPLGQSWNLVRANGVAVPGTDGASPLTELLHDQVYWLRLAPGAAPAKIDLRSWIRDGDGNGLDDEWELTELGDPCIGTEPDPAAAFADTDGDGLSNGAEYRLHTSPLRADTDGDTLSDGYEVVHELVAAALDAPCAAVFGFDRSVTDSLLENTGADTGIYGVLTGDDGAPIRCQGLFGNALRLAASTGLELRNSGRVVGAAAFSISLWAAPVTAGHLLVVRSMRGRGILRATVDSYGTLTIAFGDDLLVVPFGVLDGRWHHLLLSVNGSNATLYADGAAVDTAVTGGEWAGDTAAADLQVGAVPGVPGMTGAVDDLRLFPAALELDAAVQLFQPAGDSDGDGLSDIEELRLCTQPNLSDTDADGVADGAETAAGTDPNCADSDSDGMPDGWELNHGLDPAVADAMADPDGDGRGNLLEFTADTDPRVPETGTAVVAFETGSTVVDETVGILRIPVRLQGEPEPGVTIKVVIDLASANAEAGADFLVRLPAVLILSAAARQGSVNVAVQADAVVEPDEFLVLEIRQARAAQIGQISTHRIVIRNALGVDLDSDGDQLPDAWELQFFGHLRNDADSDPDGDGESNIREYRLGRHPGAGARAVSAAALGLEIRGVRR